MQALGKRPDHGARAGAGLHALRLRRLEMVIFFDLSTCFVAVVALAGFVRIPALPAQGSAETPPAGGARRAGAFCAGRRAFCT